MTQCQFFTLSKICGINKDALAKWSKALLWERKSTKTKESQVRPQPSQHNFFYCIISQFFSWGCPDRCSWSSSAWCPQPASGRSWCQLCWAWSRCSSRQGSSCSRLPIACPGSPGSRCWRARGCWMTGRPGLRWSRCSGGSKIQSRHGEMQ